MSSILHATVALVDQTGHVSAATLTKVAASLQTQVDRDLSVWWPVSCTVTTYPANERVPLTMWPIYIVKALPAGEGGYHWITGRNQPYAVVELGAGWTVAASHELCEMLVDPLGNRLQSAPAIILNGAAQSLGTNEESYLVEVADPCEATGYTINGIAVSDFITPNFYLAETENLQYSFTGKITMPMEILFGGYISWLDPTTNDMMQITWLDPSQPPTVANLGSNSSLASLKEHVDNHTQTVKALAHSTTHPAVQRAQAMGWTI
jgi:hypothetical protein